MKNNTGFTLLEIIIVIIIVGVLASLALPRFFKTVEYSRSTEAMGSIQTIRDSMERCYLATGGAYTSCDIASLDVEDPGTSPNAHFSYSIDGGTDTYTIKADRLAHEGGNTNDWIALKVTSGAISRAGFGAFENIK